MNSRYPIRRHSMTRWEAKMIELRLNWNNQDYWINIGEKLSNFGCWFGIIFAGILILLALIR